MPILPVAPPTALTTTGGFDYVTVDAVNRRMYAAHTGAGTLLIVNSDTGTLVGEVKVGPMHGVAYDSTTDTAYVGIGEDEHAVAAVDPKTLKVVNRVEVPAHVDAIAYDPQLHRIYADEDDGTRIFVVDSQSFKYIGSIALPGHKPEYIVVNPKTHEIYQNIDDLSEFVVIDPKTLAVTRVVKTPELQHNHPLQYDPPFDQIVVGGLNNKISVYSSAGARLATVPFPTRMDQCDLDVSRHWLACGRAKITLLKLAPSGTASVVGEVEVAPQMRTMAIDGETGDIWVVWGGDTNAQPSFYQRFTYKP